MRDDENPVSRECENLAERTLVEGVINCDMSVIEGIVTQTFLDCLHKYGKPTQQPLDVLHSYYYIVLADLQSEIDINVSKLLKMTPRMFKSELNDELYEVLLNVTEIVIIDEKFIRNLIVNFIVNMLPHIIASELQNINNFVNKITDINPSLTILKNINRTCIS